MVHATPFCALGCFCHRSQQCARCVSSWLSPLHRASSSFSFSTWNSFLTPLHQGLCVSLILHSHISFSYLFSLKQGCSVPGTQMTSYLCSFVPAFLSCPLLLPRENIHISHSPFYLPWEGTCLSLPSFPVLTLPIHITPKLLHVYSPIFIPVSATTFIYFQTP